MAFVTDSTGAIQSRFIYREEIDATYIYSGQADPGTATSAASWSISRETIADGSINYASGGAFTQIWDNRAALSYA